ncbi:12925_t:CDS:2 [Funneliformis geosporum]|nr:12925_t:CDS:2 [Funneliformis geosporum]
MKLLEKLLKGLIKTICSKSSKKQNKKTTILRPQNQNNKKTAIPPVLTDTFDENQAFKASENILGKNNDQKIILSFE